MRAIITTIFTILLVGDAWRGDIKCTNGIIYNNNNPTMLTKTVTITKYNKKKTTQ